MSHIEMISMFVKIRHHFISSSFDHNKTGAYSVYLYIVRFMFSCSLKQISAGRGEDDLLTQVNMELTAHLCL